MIKGQVAPVAVSANAQPANELNPRPRILVVDDEPDIRQLNTEALRQSGYHVDAAEDGAVAWNTLQVSNYDLLLTDHNMPRVTGVELLQKIHAANMNLPVILVTGDPPIDELSRHPWLQIEAMLLKPYRFEELLATVRNVLFATHSDPAPTVPPPNRHEPPPANTLWGR